MRLEHETPEIELIAKAIQAISKEINYDGLAKALLKAALGYSGAARGAVVAIADTGVGIECASTERLFDTLYTTKGEGLGLGLSICRKIVSVHGGRLWVTENTTYGVTFAFTLPLRQSVQMSGRN